MCFVWIWEQTAIISLYNINWLVFVTAFAKLPKATVSFVVSVRTEQLDFHMTDFHPILHLSIFRKPVSKIQVTLQSDNNNRYFTWRPIYIFFSYLAQFFSEWEMFQTKVVEKIKTHILCSVTFFRKSCRLWDSVRYTQTGPTGELNTHHARCVIHTRTRNM